MKANFSRIDALVRNNSDLPKYVPELAPAQQGLPSFLEALWGAGLMTTVSSAKEVREEKEKVDPSEVCITGSVHFPGYLIDESDKTRARLALEAAEQTLMDGYNMVIVVSPKTPQEYSQALEDMARRVNRGKMVLVAEEGRTYSGARRQAVNEAIQQISPKYVVTCELEKKELEKYYQDFLRPLAEKTGRVGIVTMDRGIFQENPNLPFAQDWGEMHQERAIMRHMTDAGFLPDGTKPMDLLNGTRIMINSELDTNAGVKVNPLDIMRLRYEYEDPATDPGVAMKEKLGVAYGVDHYSAAVYHLVTMAAAMGIGVEEVRVPYVHDEKQRALEEGEQKQMFERKREAQARAIIDQNFDLVANILSWKEEGKWPSVVLEAIETGNPIKLKHFSSLDWVIENGKLRQRG